MKKLEREVQPSHITKPNGWFGAHRVLCPESNATRRVTLDYFAGHSSDPAINPVCVKCVNIILTGNLIRQRGGGEWPDSTISEYLEGQYQSGTSPEALSATLFASAFAETVTNEAKKGNPAAQKLQDKILEKADPVLAESIKKSREEKT